MTTTKKAFDQLLSASEAGDLETASQLAIRLYGPSTLFSGDDIPTPARALYRAALGGHIRILEWFATSIPACRSPQGSIFSPTWPYGEGDTYYNVPTLLLGGAEERNCVELVRWLLANGQGDVDVVRERDMTVLASALVHHHWEIAGLLIEAGGKVNASRYTTGEHPMTYSAGLNGDFELLEFLIEHGVKVEGCGALHGAAEEGNVESAKRLIGMGIDVDDQYRSVWAQQSTTPMYVAVLNDQAEFVDFLLQNGANPDFASEAGTSPRELAYKREDEAVLKVLQKDTQ